MSDWTALQKRLAIEFGDVSVLQQAFVHRSYINENPDFSLGTNERLEFLGDAFLGFVIAFRLYHEFESLDEGEMTKLRSVLVCQESLAHLALSMNLGEYLYLGQGEEKGGGRGRERNLACVLEALIGAVLVDRGVDSAREFVLNLFDEGLKQAAREGALTDHKSRLQELVQARRMERPSYRLVNEEGPDHDKTFWVEVVVNGEILGKGSGKSKQLAEKEAARQALEHWH